MAELAQVAAEAAELGLPEPVVRRVSLAAGALSALRWGTGPARVVALHGAALNAHTWDGTLARWGVDALALDLPGHGDSLWRDDGDYSPTTLAGPVAACLRAAVDDGLVADRPVLVGQSLGGLTALGVAPGLPTAQVLLVDVLPLPPQAGAQIAAFLAGPASFDSREEVLARAVAFGFGGSHSRLQRAVHLNTRLREDGSVVWKHHLGALASTGELRLRTDGEVLWPVLRDLAAPVDLVRGERGLVGPELLARLARERPQARVVTLDTGHNVQEDAPVVLADALAGLAGRLTALHPPRH